MKKLIVYTICLLCSTTCLNGQNIQNQKITNQKILEEAFPETFGSSIIEAILPIDDTHEVVRYLRDGIYHESILHSTGEKLEILETAKMIVEEDLPERVKDAFYSDHGSEYFISLRYRVHRPNSENIYRIDAAESQNDKVIEVYYYDETGEKMEKVH